MMISGAGSGHLLGISKSPTTRVQRHRNMDVSKPYFSFSKYTVEMCGVTG